ncbi:MAG: UbiA family prenyltransferase [Planctomycetes bacterium]|nr:UbiA family prenyltransferase [Planctomycetota bacterium]
MAAVEFGSTRLGARLRLLRFSNFPSPIADVLAGAAISRVNLRAGFRSPQDPALPWDFIKLIFAIAASVCIYHAGMVLNDLADRAEDTKTRPGRPIPSGAVSVREAIAWGVLLTIGALACSIPASNWKVILPLAAVVYLYNFASKRGSWAGPLFLGCARALNVLAGVAALDYVDPNLDYYPSAMSCDETQVFAAVAGYGAAIMGLSIFAINEDRPFSKLRSWLGGCFAVAGITWATYDLWSPVWQLAWIPFVEPLSVILGPSRPWTPDRVGQVVGASLRSTMIYQALVCYSCGAPEFAVVCGAGYVASRILSRWIPPT